MSNKALTWAWGQELPASAKFVLVALADFADENASCFPSQQTIAGMTGMGVRTVRRAIAELESLGMIVTESRHRGDGTRTSDRFVLMLDHSPAANLAGGTSGQKVHDQRPNTTGQAANLAGHIEPSVEPSLEPSLVRARGKAREVPLPADWAPSDALRQFAAERGVDVDREAEMFRAHAEAHDRRVVRWDSAFRQWLLKARPYTGSGRTLTEVWGAGNEWMGMR